MKNGIPYFAPGQRLKFFLTNLTGDKKKLKSSFQLKVTYKDAMGNPYENTYKIDFSSLEGLTQVGTPPLYEIAKTLERIRWILDKMYQPLDDLKRWQVKQFIENHEKSKGSLQDK